MRTALVLILCLFAAGCVTQKACYEKFPPQTGTVNTVTYHDTVYFFRTDTDTLWAVASWMDTVSVDGSMVIGQAWVARDSIYIKVIQKDTVFQWRDSIRTEIREVTKTVQVPCQKTPVLNKIIWIVALVLAGGVLIFIKSMLH